MGGRVEREGVGRRTLFVEKDAPNFGKETSLIDNNCCMIERIETH